MNETKRSKRILNDLNGIERDSFTLLWAGLIIAIITVTIAVLSVLEVIQ